MHFPKKPLDIFSCKNSIPSMTIQCCSQAQPTLTSEFRPVFRAITSGCVNLCKIKKCSLFTHFGSKNTHISWGKIVHLCTIATVTVHICTATVAFAYHILVFFSLLPFLLLSIPSDSQLFCFLNQIRMAKHSQLSLSLISFLWLPRLPIATNLSPPLPLIATTTDC